MIPRRSFPLLLCLAIIFIAGACSSSRNATKEAQSPTRTAVKGQRFDFTTDLASTYADWTDLYVPVSLDVEAPVNFGISGRATMVRGKEIHISLRIMGIEVAVAHVDNDSAWVVDKHHKCLCSIPTSSLTCGGRFSISDLQDLILGRAFYPGRGTINTDAQTKELFSIQNRGDSVLMLPRRIPTDKPWLYMANNIPELTTFAIKLSDEHAVQINYSDFAQTEAGAIANQVDGIGEVQDIVIAGRAKWNLKKAKWNSGRTSKWSPPSNYERISTVDLIKALKFE